MKLMYQNRSLGQNIEINYNIFYKQLLLYNETYDLVQEYMFIVLLNEFCSNISVDVFFNQTGPENSYFLKLLFQDALFSLLCEITCHSHIFVKVTCKLFMNMF